MKRRPTRECVRIALRHWDQHRCWQAILEMQMRGSEETLALVRRLAGSANWRRRTLGMYVASQLRQRRGNGEGRGIEFGVHETQRLLVAGLKDNHDEVVRAAISGLGHRPLPDALERLVALDARSNAPFQLNLASTLGYYDSPSASEVLLRLANDSDDLVRDWATFSLGTMHSADSQPIRDQLWKNLHDVHEDVRGEALIGLANRGDPRAVAHLIAHLSVDSPVYELEAAQALADPALWDTLSGLADALTPFDGDGHWEGRLAAAIAACGRAP